MGKKWTFCLSKIVIYILVWTIVNMLFLSVFPFMHTDEAWLAGLSRTMIAEKNLAATESFFNILPRSPHAIKILFHLFQMLFIKTAGFSLYSIRLLSLFTGAAALLFFSKFLEKLSLPPLAGTMLLSLEIQFIYISHFGRQEVFILLLMLISLNALFSEKHQGFMRGLLSGLPIAAAAGFHPNAFIAAWPPGVFLLILIVRKKRRITEGFGFIITTAAGAAAFMMLSFLFNRGFVADYGSFGAQVGFFDPLDVKLLGFDDFYKKLFLRISGTYYTPNIIPLFISGAVGGAAALVSRIRTKDVGPALFALLGIVSVNIGIILIGKYSAPSVIFLSPFLVILICCGVEVSITAARRILYAAAAVILILNSASMIAEETRGERESFKDFSEKISMTIPAGDRALGGLAAGFYFNEGQLLDWRNLAFLKNAEMSLDEYIQKSGIEYIIYSDEIDYIYNSRPVWNILYGNPVIYYDQMQQFISKRCDLVSEFSSPGYGTRLMMKRFERDWMIRMYRVRQAE